MNLNICFTIMCCFVCVCVCVYCDTFGSSNNFQSYTFRDVFSKTSDLVGSFYLRG